MGFGISRREIRHSTNKPIRGVRLISSASRAIVVNDATRCGVFLNTECLVSVK